MVALLEEIAFNTSIKLMERAPYLEKIYAIYGARQSARIETEKSRGPAKLPGLDPSRQEEKTFKTR